MQDLRIECPQCGTSFHAEKLGLKTGPEDKVVIQCLCGQSLETSFDHSEEHITGNWLSELFGRARQIRKVIHARVDSSAG